MGEPTPAVAIVMSTFRCMHEIGNAVRNVRFASLSNIIIIKHIGIIIFGTRIVLIVFFKTGRVGVVGCSS